MPPASVRDSGTAGSPAAREARRRGLKVSEMFADSSGNGSPASHRLPACRASWRVASMSVAFSARRKAIAWRLASGLPKVVRVRACATASSCAHRASPTQVAAMAIRLWVRKPPKATSSPCPSSPSRLATGTGVRSKVMNRFSPVRSRCRPPGPVGHVDDHPKRGVRHGEELEQLEVPEVGDVPAAVPLRGGEAEVAARKQVVPELRGDGATASISPAYCSPGPRTKASICAASASCSSSASTASRPGRPCSPAAPAWARSPRSMRPSCLCGSPPRFGTSTQRQSSTESGCAARRAEPNWQWPPPGRRSPTRGSTWPAGWPTRVRTPAGPQPPA